MSGTDTFHLSDDEPKLPSIEMERAISIPAVVAAEHERLCMIDMILHR